MALPAPDLARLVGDLRRTRALVTPEELAHRLPPMLPTGLGGLDRLLGGGLPQGRIVELGEAGGALGTAVALRILARFTAGGRLAAVVDRADAFDPRSAAEAGVDLARTLWCRPTTHRDAVRAADALLASGAFPLVILDLGPARGPRRGAGRWAQGGAAGGREAGRGDGGRGGAGRWAPAGVGRVREVGNGVLRGDRGTRGDDGRDAADEDGGAVGPRLIRTAPGEGAPPDEPRLERYAVRRRRPDPDADVVTQGAWLRLARDAEAARASLLVLGGAGAGTFAAAALRPIRCCARFLGEGPGRTFEGLELTLALERNKLGLPPGEVILAFRAPELFPGGSRDPLPGAARVSDDPAASRRKAWWDGGDGAPQGGVADEPPLRRVAP